MADLLLIGQAPSASHGALEPFSGRSGARLAALAGVALDVFLAKTTRVNLIEQLPAVMEMIASHRLTVIVGVGTARAMRVRLSTFTWNDAFRDGISLVAVCPHPSGVNRWWNDPSNVDRARAFWRGLFQPWDAPNKV